MEDNLLRYYDRYDQLLFVGTTDAWMQVEYHAKYQPTWREEVVRVVRLNRQVQK